MLCSSSRVTSQCVKYVGDVAEILHPLMQRARFHGKWQYLFIESICNDPAVLEQNYRYKMMYSADYKDVDTNEVSMCGAVTDPWHLDRAVWPGSHLVKGRVKPTLSRMSKVTLSWLTSAICYILRSGCRTHCCPASASIPS